MSPLSEFNTVLNQVLALTEATTTDADFYRPTASRDTDVKVNYWRCIK